MRISMSWWSALALVAVACGDDSAPTGDAGPLDALGSDASLDAETGMTPRFEAGPCPVAFPGLVEGETVRCGRLVVLQDRARPDGLTLGLSVVIVSMVERPAAEPIVHLLGGPGLSVRAYQEVLADFAGDLSESTGREVVLFDQRGTGDSEPFLACGAVESFPACTARLAGDGIDLAFFDTASSADDVEDLRRALGAPALHLYGQSYGTVLALEVMRRHPDVLRSVLLESTSSVPFDAFLTSSPRSFELAFSRVAAECAADAECAEAFPEPQADLETILASLTPGSEESIGLATVIRTLMQNARGSSLVPLLLSSVVDGDVDTVTAIVAEAQGLAREQERVFRRFSELMYWTMTCGDYASLFTDEENERVNGASHPVLRAVFGEDAAGLRGVCDALPRREPDLSAVRSDVPTLLVAGTHDDNTPLEVAEAVAAELGAARVLAVRGWGHVMLARGNACVQEAYTRFVADPAGARDPACVAAQRTSFPRSVE
ncbi:MAG: alpha/beta fold hydrolase [Myxococcales bacterium]|nr:alpha/beta fold hydrolase [Myxococcales bacterium]